MTTFASQSEFGSKAEDGDVLSPGFIVNSRCEDRFGSSKTTFTASFVALFYMINNSEERPYMTLILSPCHCGTKGNPNIN